jgi:RHS repeat-associated protein
MRCEKDADIYLTPNRAYSPAIGRWLQPDPLGTLPNPKQGNGFSPLSQYTDGRNLYEYCAGDPINERDMWGLKKSTYQIRKDYLYTFVFPTTKFPYMEWRRTLIRIYSEKQANSCECQNCCDDIYEEWKESVGFAKWLLSGKKTIEACYTLCQANLAPFMLP